MMRINPAWAAAPLVGLVLAGCGGPKALTLPTDPIDRAATCSVVAAAQERTAAGVKGELSADAQGRIFHYGLLAASEGGSYDAAKATAVFQRSPALSEQVTKAKWQEARPACDAAYPATTNATPALPAGTLDSQLQCFMTLDFMRKALAEQGAAYSDAVRDYGLLYNKLDPIVGSALTRAGVKGDAVQERRRAAQAEAARLGQPGAVIAACEKKFG